MEKENKEINESNSMELMKLVFEEVKRNSEELNRINEEVKRNSKELNHINEELKLHTGILNEHHKKFDKIEKKLEEHDNKFNRIEQKIDSNFKYMNEKVDNTKNKLVSEMVDELDKFSVSTTKLINNLENKLKNEQDERIMEISKMKGINDYNKLILKNLESRISILEEETEKYNLN